MSESLYDPDDFQYVTRSTAARQFPTVDGTYRFDEVDELQNILDEWSGNQSRVEFDPIPTLTALSELMEKAMDEFMKMDPDPLDDRHPVRTHPHAAYGNLLKPLFKRDEFMNKLVISYLSNRENVDLCIAASRLLLACVPGLDSEVIFSEPEDFVPRLFEWARASDNETLQAYSMGLLSSAMEVQDNASKYRNLNAQLISIALRRLFELKEKMVLMRQSDSNTATTSNTPEPGSPGPFSGVDLNDDASRSNDSKQSDIIIYKDLKGAATAPQIGLGGSTQPMRIKPKLQENGGSSPPRKKIKSNPSFGSLQDLENSNSCWSRLQPYVIGKHKVYPLTIEMHQRLILQFLGPTGEYQDLLSLAIEGNSMDLILYYINLENTRDVRFTFDALRYLTSLLVHRKFALDFVARGGVQQLLKIPRLCMASVGAITCFYYLSYNEEVMEKVCQLDGAVLDDLVDYALWCLEHSYESGMASASMFFTHAFYYKAILMRFDQQDGMRRLYNYISTLALLLDPSICDRLSDEMLHTSIQSVRNASASFRSYVSAHIYVKLEQMKKACKGLTQFLKLPVETIAPHKVMEMADDSLDFAVELLTAMLKVSPSGWKPIEHARELGLVNSMFNLLEYIQEWNAGSGKSEMIRNALEVIWLCSPLIKVREDFCRMVPNSAQKFDGFRILTTIADADWYEEENVQQHALKTILNCVQNTHIYKGAFRLDTKRSRVSASELSESEKIIWECLRKHDIIMVLNGVVRQTLPVLEADRLRDLSCRCMLGLARCDEVRQILSKLPIIANNDLQSFMKMPVAQDKKSDHTKFCRSAKELIEAVTQRSINERIPDPKDLTQERLWKSYVVSNTRITYNEKELLQLIHGHLVKKGLSRTAAELIKEAELPDVPASRVLTPAKIQPLPNVHSYNTESTPGTSTASLYSNSTRAPRTPMPKTPINKRLILRTPGTGKSPFTQNPIKKIQPFKGLDGIVTDYFRQQHSNCANPVTTCPPFSLFFPHQCPEPRSFGSVSYNLVKRFGERPVRRTHDLRKSLFHDEKYAFSRFRTSRNYSDQEEMYTCCAFSIDDEHLIVGMFNGDVFWINVETGNEDSHTVCHSSSVTDIQPSRDGNMLLTSSAFIRPLSTLWRLRETQEHCYDFPSEHKVKFSNLTLDRIIGTSDENGKATVYDTETGRAICVYKYGHEDHNARYRHNAASFSPDDTAILNDGILWDVRDSVKPTHIFDKLNPLNSGVFHPHGNEVIINSEVWDLRTFRLLHTVPALDMCEVNFNSTGNIIYATAHVEDDVCRQFSASFRTFDSKDYSVITTVDTKRNILDIACSHGDQLMAVIERRIGTDYLDPEQSTVKLFEIGKKRDAEDDLDEGEEDNDDADNRGDDEDDDSDSMSSMSSNSLSGDDIDVFGALGHYEHGSSESSMTDEEDDEDDGEDAARSDSDGDTDDSDGWETASGEGNNDNNEGPVLEDANLSDDEDEQDVSFEPNQEVEHPSTSTVALNPQIRRQKRRHSDTGANN